MASERSISNREKTKREQKEAYKTKGLGELVSELVEIGDTSSIYNTGIGGGS
jgi:hypothetical protein